MTSGSNGSQVAMVTGGASGIGLAGVQRLIERGFHVAVLDLPGPSLDTVARESSAAVPFAVDVSDDRAVAAAAGHVESEMGPVHHVFACAGVARVGRTVDVVRSDVDLMMRVNYGGVVNVIDAVLPPMLARRRGEIAVVASATGLVPPRKMAAYGATKAAVISYLESLRYDIEGSGVALTCVCPAAVRTPMADDFFRDPEKRARSMAIRPEQVIAATEKGLRRGKFLVVPGMVAKATVRLTRVAPGLTRRLQQADRFDLVADRKP